LRFYGYSVDEIASSTQPYLDLERDPKSAWAESHPEFFPVNINQAPQELLLRVPGLGVRTVHRLLAGRRWHRLNLIDLRRLRVPLTKALPFIETADYYPRERSKFRYPGRAEQLDFFEEQVSALSGEL
jgi:predicted DNA-binding helix-hairpin-helix protein